MRIQGTQSDSIKIWCKPKHSIWEAKLKDLQFWQDWSSVDHRLYQRPHVCCPTTRSWRWWWRTGPRWCWDQSWPWTEGRGSRASPGSSRRWMIDHRYFLHQFHQNFQSLLPVTRTLKEGQVSKSVFTCSMNWGIILWKIVPLYERPLGLSWVLCPWAML